ncbi:hypothetical protein ABW20_dc0109553 [Dactylellina cionopaga]|nr:hypothetical protein ABW20_dc0109553 [Dactylellina cionopaga]
MSESVTWFDKLDVSFESVPTEPVDTAKFLGASKSLVTLFDLLGATAFGAVKSDMTGNITKIEARVAEAPEKSTNLQQLVTEEWAEKQKKATATEGLLWLLRGLDFTAKAIRHNVSNPTEELATSFQHSYDGTLKKHHNFVVKGIFSVALKATPYRKDFYIKLGAEDEAGRTKVDNQLQGWLKGLEAVVETTQKFYESHPEIKF